jgi:hypothetical protein
MGYGALRRECLEAVRQWPGCEKVSGIQIIRENMPGGFSIRVTLYGKSDKKNADRAIACVQREKRRISILPNDAPPARRTGVNRRSCCASFFGDVLFRAPTAFAAEGDEVWLGLPDFVPGHYHDGAAAQARRILSGV